MKHIKSLVTRYDAWLGSKRIGVGITADLLVFPGVLMLSAWLLPRQENGFPTIPWGLAYAFVNTIATVFAWMHRTARDRRIGADRDAMYAELRAAYRSEAEERYKLLRNLLKARKLVDQLAPDERAKALAALDALEAKIGLP